MQPANYVLVTTYLSHSLGNDRAFAENRSAMKPRRRINRGSQCAIQLSNSGGTFPPVLRQLPLALPCAARRSSKQSHSCLQCNGVRSPALCARVRLLSIPTSFIRSTIDRFQSNFSGFLAASPFITAAISTIGGRGLWSARRGRRWQQRPAVGLSCYSWLCRWCTWQQRAPER